MPAEGGLKAGDIPPGAAVGIVEESRHRDFPVGTRVLSDLGWRSGFVAAPAEASLFVLNDSIGAPELHLGILGLTGITAWRGIEDVLAPVEGETVFITGAAGAVGTVACQLAKSRGARVLASAGSQEKVAWLVDELGVDAVVNHRRQSIVAFLDEAAPGGIDSYFDNVGGAVLDAVLTRMKVGGRIALCGAMSLYEQSHLAGPTNFFTVLERSLRLEGFSAFTLSVSRRAAIVSRLNELIVAGTLIPHQTVVTGLSAAPEALATMFRSGHLGKLLVRL